MKYCKLLNTIVSNSSRYYLNYKRCKKHIYSPNFLTILEEEINILENKYELILPNSQYLGCVDKSLAICKYNTLITYKPSTGEANVREVIRNDCFIGTMGCNKYEKGLELNLRRCNVINNISTSN